MKRRASGDASTPAKPSERIYGSDTNKPGSAGKDAPASAIDLGEGQEKALRRMVREHNASVSKASQKTDVGAAKKIMRRAMGAYSQTHRPGASRSGWGYKRVEAFFHLLRHGKPKNPNYVQDNDLLPSGHPRASQKSNPPKDAPSDPAAYLSARELDRSYTEQYVQGGEVVASSRLQRSELPALPVGTWKVDDTFKGLYGHDVEELVELDPLELEPGEFQWDDLQGSMLPGRYEDAARYAAWMAEGQDAPPISVVQTDRGTLRITDGHRRAAAAFLAGLPVRAWVSWSVPHPHGSVDSQGRPMTVGATYELVTGEEYAMRRNAEDDDEWFEEEERLFEKMERERKEFELEALRRFEDNQVVVVRGNSFDFVTLTPSTYPGVRYQITRWDIEDGQLTPLGHTDITGDLASAVKELRYHAKTKDGAEFFEEHEMHANSRHADLMKQGFMKPRSARRGSDPLQKLRKAVSDYERARTSGTTAELQRAAERVASAQKYARERGVRQSEINAVMAEDELQANGSYYVWLLRKGSNEPMTTEGPYGPHDWEGAKTFARIGAAKGDHDRVVSRGRDPKTDSFEILRRYAAGTGERLI